MKILVLDEFLSYPINSGKKVRTCNILKQLSLHHEITLLVYVWGDKDELAGIEYYKSLGINTETVERNNPEKKGLKFYISLFKNLFSSLPYIVDSHYKASYASRLSRLINEWQPDILMAEWSPYSIYFSKITGIPKVAVAHNLESRIWRGYVEKCTNPIKRWYISHQNKKVLRFEDDIFKWLDGLILVSPVELKTINKKYPALNAILVDNGVDIDYFALSDIDEDNRLVSFVGVLDWRPNQDGVNYFIDTILPILRNKVKDVKVSIIGRDAPEWLSAKGARHNVEFTGPVDDVRPFMYKSAVMIVPLRIGGGSRLKILESLSMGKAVVSTCLGAEGLNLKDGEHLLITDEPERFADTIVELLNNPEKRRQLGENGRKLVTSQYQWKDLAAVQNKFLEKIVSSR